MDISKAAEKICVLKKAQTGNMAAACDFPLFYCRPGGKAVLSMVGERITADAAAQAGMRCGDAAEMTG
ncbi:MAG: hypothetical protein Q4G07_01155 [Oscillospiraceae bacterium]|nr:hypothetical protein [Oscillospiraceae bacterium]